MASGTLPKSTESVEFPRWDFSEGYLNPKFSDCVIRLLPEGPGEPKRKGRGRGKPQPQPVDLPASSLLLASQSDFFKTLLAGDFKESADSKKEVTISLDPADFNCFKDILLYYYSGRLPPSYDDSTASSSEGGQGSSTVQKLIQVLLVADRFSFLHCVKLCASRLNARAPEFTACECEGVLCLPGHLLEVSELKPSIEAAKKVVVQEAASLLLTNTDNEADPAFLRLPEPCICAMLDSDLLGVESEDLVCHSTWKWVKNRFSAPKSRLAVLKRLLPQIRFQFMYPAYTLWILDQLPKIFEDLDIDSWRKSTAKELIECARNLCELMDKKSESVVGATSTAVASQILSIITLVDPEPGLGRGGPAGEIFFKSLGRCARIGCSPKTVAIVLEIPLASAEAWSEEDPVEIESSPHSLNGG